MTPRAAAVIVNYNCAPLALDAAASFLGAGGTAAVIVDNASTDDSADVLRRARPRTSANAPPNVRFALPVAPATRSPLTPAKAGVHAPTRKQAARWAPAFAGASGDGEAAGAGACPPSLRERGEKSGLTILLSDRNGGFAAGCNLGLKALDRSAFDFILLLNPDALVAAGAIEAFAARLEDPSIGLCGASVLMHEAPHFAQAFGGARLDPWTLAGENLGAGLPLADAPSTEDIERRLDYPLGAAIAFRPDYVDRAGFLDERYFLYFEEADWALSGRAFSRVGWARDAVVYHRYGASSRSRRTTARTERSPLADYHMARSRLLFALKWRAPLAPALVAAGWAQAARRLARGKLAEARAVAIGSLPGAPRRFPA